MQQSLLRARMPALQLMLRALLFALLISPSIVFAEKQNLLLITIDTLRADHLGSYGNRSVKTPNLDAIAKSSLFFENAVSPAPLTLPSHTSLLTGRYPYKHGVQDNAGQVSESETTLAEILRQNGYHTYAFIGGFPLDHRFGLNQGFEVYNDIFPRVAKRSLDFRSERTADSLLNALFQTHIQPPFFLWVHFYDPHAPYLNGGYSGEIEFVDHQVGLLLKKFEKFQPVIAVAGDHGESLGEHGELTHRIFVYDSAVRVPFFIHIPGKTPQRISKQARLIDFLPTILNLYKLPIPPNLDGTLMPDKAGADAYLESLFPQFQLGWSPLVAVRTDEWKFIQAPRPELYHLKNDPNEKINLIGKHPKIEESLRKKIPARKTPAPKTNVDPETAEQLAALGYVSGGSNVVSKSTIDPKDRIQIWNQIEKAVDLEGTKPEESILILEQARKSDPENPMILGFLAQEYAKAGREEKAAEILKIVLGRDPKNTLALYRMASVMLKSRQFTDAEKWAQKLIHQESKNADAWILLARARMGLNQLREGIAAIESALKIDPNDYELRTDLGHLYLEVNEPARAQKQFEQVLSGDTKNLQALNGLATCLFQAGNFAESEKKLLEAYRIGPQDPQTKMNLALLYSKQGKTSEAAALYREIISSSSVPAEWKQEASRRLKELP